jgi:hypothetical protein
MEKDGMDHRPAKNPPFPFSPIEKKKGEISPI